MMPRELDAKRFLRVLGDEIRKLRNQHGWTRDRWRILCFPDISTQTLATYELGTRPMTVVRFAMICESLGEMPDEVMRRTLDRVELNPERVTGWLVDLPSASQLPEPELAPLRNWADLQLQSGAPKTVLLRIAAIESLSVLCGLDVPELARRLPRPQPVIQENVRSGALAAE